MWEHKYAVIFICMLLLCVFQGSRGLNGPRGRPGPPGQPVSVTFTFFYKYHFCIHTHTHTQSQTLVSLSLILSCVIILLSCLCICAFVHENYGPVFLLPFWPRIFNQIWDFLYEKPLRYHPVWLQEWSLQELLTGIETFLLIALYSMFSPWLSYFLCFVPHL